MASCNVMLSRFRFDDSTILSTLVREKSGAAATPMHASIIMASQAPEQVA